VIRTAAVKTRTTAVLLRLRYHILTATKRVREAVKARSVRHRVEPKLPVDVLGAYVYLPEGAA